MTVNFSPVTAGNATGTLTILSDVSPVTIPLLGIGVGPQPVVSGLSPASTTAGGSGFNLTVNGSNFVSGSQVSFNLTNVATTFVSSSQLTALISAGSITTAGNPNVTLTAPGSNVSAPVSFTVNDPAPQASEFSCRLAGWEHGAHAEYQRDEFHGEFHGSGQRQFARHQLCQFHNAASDSAGERRGAGGTLDIAISNPPPGGGTTPAIIFNVADFAVTPPATPGSVSAGQPGAFVFVGRPIERHVRRSRDVQHID